MSATPGAFADAVIVAAGSSSRMAGTDKLAASLGDRSLLRWTVESVASARSVGSVIVVVEPSQVDALAASDWLRALDAQVLAGGARRQDTVAVGVRAATAAVVLVHDGARPFVTATLVDAVADAAAAHGAAIPVLPVVDSLKRVSGPLGGGMVTGMADRAGLFRAQTPQGARRELLLAAVEALSDGSETFGDEAELLARHGVDVSTVAGDAANLKVTVPADLEMARAAALGLSQPRYGMGSDSHPFGPQDGLRLGGIEIPEAPRLHGHSDGDAALHAVCDGLLAAAAMGDLGRLFPAGDPATRGIDSRQLLGSVVDRLAAAGWRPGSLDLTILGARPRLGGQRLEGMRAALTALLGVDATRVSVKASTGNLAGPEGSGRVISATALVDRGQMTLRFRNTLGGALEPFEPLEPGHVRVYSCGPTVYAPAHIGNFRSFMFADLLRRYLAWKGYAVTWVMNVTDVDDKIIRDATSQGISIGELTERHTATFMDDLRRLRITTPDQMPRATAHIPEMVELISTLLEKGHAYRTDDGSIFFRISSWPAYGRLARLDPDQQRVGERVEADEYSKDDVRDFALWKGPREGEPSWPTAIGAGRPGWHIECSAMSMRYLGPSFDIHTGGIDLVFPHHEDEIAQSEAATGKPFVQTWLHCAHLQMGGQKMAKRSGNFARPADIYADGASPRALRYALLAAHYRASLDFSEDSLAMASSAVERLSTALSSLDGYRQDGGDDATLPALLADARTAFEAGLDDDLNIAPALGAVFDLVRELNRRVDARTLSTADAARAAAALRDLDSVLGVAEEDREDLPAAVAALLDERAAARDGRDWARADALRQELARAGVLVEDTRDGQRWRRQEAVRDEA